MLRDAPSVVEMATSFPGRCLYFPTSAWPEDIETRIEALVQQHMIGCLFPDQISLANCLGGMLRSDRNDQLVPTVVVEARSRVVLGMVYSNRESLAEAIKSATGVYHSRRRGLWRKGESSGDTQRLVRVSIDCDSDSLCFEVECQGQNRAFCHVSERRSCFGIGVEHTASLNELL